MRNKILFGFIIFVFCLMASPTSSQEFNAAIVPSSVDIPLETNWITSDLPEGAFIENNLEDYADQLSDLHDESDIGSHSNPAKMMLFDGVYNTITSDNITIPEHTIYDDDGNPLYNQSEYESWQLDLEVGWTNVDYDEINAELCIRGGIQAEEALRIDIWVNNTWVSVIADVVVGWNNVSIGASLVDNTLEMRFINTNRDNTSIQNNWEIDAVLLHTWTTIYSEEFTSNGIIQDVGNGLFRFIGSIGERNTWNGTHWVRYMYDPFNWLVKIGNLTISHLSGGALSIEGDGGSKVGKLSWYIQAYYNDVWNNITLSNYQFIGFTKTADNVSMNQRFWGTHGEMNVTTTYSYYGGFKTRVDIRNDAVQAVPIRAIWAAQDISGIQGNYELLRDEDDLLYGIRIEDATFNWYDVYISDNPLPVNTVIDKPNRRAAVIFGNQSTIIPAGYTATIDPDYTVGADADDDEWDIEGGDVHYTAQVHNRVRDDGATDKNVAQFRVALPIEQYSIIQSGTMYVYAASSDATDTAYVHRIDELNVGSLEADDTRPSTDGSSFGEIDFTASVGWKTAEVGVAIQKQIGLSGWKSGYYIGFRITPDASTQSHSIEDYSDGTSNHAYLSVTYTAPAGNQLTGFPYRQGHSITGSTGAGTNYPIRLNVEYGIGLSQGLTLYLNEHCQTDFDDVRFTDGDGQTELDYWREEKTNGDDATFWVEVADDLGSDQIIYCYYGNATVSTTSSGPNTFIFFDDFENNNFNRWTLSDENWVIDSTIEKMGSYCAQGDSDGTGRLLAYDLPSALSSNFMIHSWLRTIETIGSKYPIHSYEDTTSVYALSITGDNWATYSNGWVYYEEDVVVVNTWYRTEIAYDFSNSLFKLWVDRSYKDTQTLNAGDATPVIYIDRIASLTASTADKDHYLDDYYVRKWQTLEPASYTWSAEEMGATPENDQAPVCTNLDDTDNLYARYRIYNFSVSVTDADGAEDIDYVELNSTYLFESYWAVRYTESDNSFSETDGASYIELTGSVYSKVGNNLDIWFGIKIEWAHPDVSNYDLEQYVVDDAGHSDADQYTEINYDYETRLDYTSNPVVTGDDAGTIDRGDIDEAFTMAGTMIYYGSGDDNPPVDEVDVWVNGSQYGTNVGPWSDLTGDGSGVWTVTCYADDIFGLDTYTMKPVANGDGSGGTSLYYTTDLTDTYIADSLTITMTDPDDQRINIGANATGIVITAVYYDYDSMPFDGTVILNDTTYDHNTVGRYGYTISSGTGDTHGITTVGTNDETYCIFDAIGIYKWIDDGRDDIDDTITVYAWLTYMYDNTNVTDGTVLLNGTGMSYGSDIWSLGRTQAIAGLYAYNITAITGNTYGITVSGDIMFDGTGDNVLIAGISSTARTQMGWFKFDILAVTKGTYVYLFNNLRQHFANNWLYPVGAGSGDYFNWVPSVDTWYHIAFMFTDKTNCSTSRLFVDGVEVDITLAAEGIINSLSRISYTATGAFNGSINQIRVYNRILSEKEVFEHYQGRCSNNTGLVLDFNMASYDVADGIWYDLSDESNDGTITSVLVNESSSNYYHIRPIWDSLTVTITNPTDQRINIGANATGMIVSAIWDYDSETYDGTLTLNDTTYDYGSVGIYYYTVTVGNGDDTYEITVVSSSDSVYCIFDRIKILTTAYTETGIHPDTGTTTINVTAELEYDHHTLGSGDTLYMNGTSMTWDTDHFYITVGPYGMIGSFYYFVNSSSANEATYGITDVWLNGQDTTVTTEVIVVISYTISDARDNINDYVWVIATLEYWTDSAPVIDGTVVQGIYSFTHIGGGEWRHNRTESTAGDITFDTLVAAGNTRDISYVDQNAQSQTAIWDQINCTIHSDKTWTIIGYNATIEIITAVHAYDGALYNGTVTLNSTGIETVAGNYSIDVDYVSGGDYGLVAGEVITTYYILWDSMTATAAYGADVTEYAVTFYIQFGPLEWVSNGTPIGIDWNCDNLRNGSVVTYATTLSDGYLNPLEQSFLVPTAWDGILYSNNASKTVNGTAYDFEWYSCEYALVLVESDWAYVNPYLPSGVGFPLESFKLFINGTRIYDRDWRFYNYTNDVYNITITDYFDAIIHQDNHTWARGIDILIDMYTVKVSHMLDNAFIYFKLTSTAGATYSEHIGPSETVTYYLYSANNYTYQYSARLNRTAESQLYEGSMTISADTYILIVSWGFEKILIDIALIEDNSGGGVSASELTQAIASQTNNVLIWTGAVALIAMIMVAPKDTISNIGSKLKRTPKPKAKSRGKAFPKGSSNPKYKDKKVQTLDEMRDKLWHDR